MNGRLVDIAVPVPVLSSFHYEMNEALASEVTLGSVVQVPFRSRSMTGFVLGFPKETKVARDKLKQVESVVTTAPVFDESMLKFLRWVAEYYCHPIGEVISTAVPRQNWEPSKTRRKKNDTETDSLEKLDLLGTPGAKPVLTEEQARAVAAILDPADLRPVLLHGVTGSGKTEVYMHALEELIGRGKGAIVLVPEIALTPQLLDRFSGRFPGLVAVLHSDLKPGERFKQWERLRSGAARVVVGARSAVFAPMRDLGLIVVDEEHEGSFKQDDSVRYHARDLAVVRASFSGAKAVLGSATPSLESYHNAKKGKYVYLRMANRVQSRPLPSTVFVDLKDKEQWYSSKARWLTRTLAEKLGENLRAGHQSMLYLNRLGYAHFLYCLDCGNTWRCLNCDVSLTYYRNPPGLKCHYCGVHKTPPETCEACQGTNLEAMGVGTEQVEKALKEIFPTARVARMDRSVVKNRRELEAILNSINGREVDIVVGTQMIAKGHDFPGVSLVGILNADSSLNMPDFRANEKTFQTITQVSGRAGRHAIAGQVVIQTLNPEHPVLVCAANNESEEFYRRELATRQQFGFPPFKRVAMLRFQHRNATRVEKYAFETAAFLHDQMARQKKDCVLLGPSEAPLSKLKNYYRWQALMKCESARELRLFLNLTLEYAVQRKHPAQLYVDVDPINAL